MTYANRNKPPPGMKWAGLPVDIDALKIIKIYAITRGVTARSLMQKMFVDYAAKLKKEMEKP